MLEQEGRAHAAHQAKGDAEQQVHGHPRLVRVERRPGRVDHLDVGHGRAHRGLYLLGALQQALVDGLVRLHLALVDLVLGCLTLQIEGLLLLLLGLFFQVEFGLQGGEVLVLDGLENAPLLGGDARLDVVHARFELAHLRIIRFEGDAQVLVFGAQCGVLALQVLDELVVHDLGEFAAFRPLVLVVAGLLGGAVGARLGQGLVELLHLAEGQVGLGVERDDADLAGKGLQFLLGFLQFHLGGVDLLLEELAGIAAGLEVAVHVHVEEGVHGRVDDRRGEFRVRAGETHLDEFAVFHRGHTELLLEPAEHAVLQHLLFRLLAEQVDLVTLIVGADEPFQGIHQAAGLGFARLGFERRIEHLVTGQLQPLDHPRGELLALQHLHLGLLELHGLERACIHVFEVGQVAGLGRHLDRTAGLELRSHAEGDQHRGEKADE